MTIRMSFAGFRHGHIFGLYDLAAKHPDVEIVGACEEDAAARAAVPQRIKVTHDSIARMLDETPCDVVAVGDYYGKRGSILIDALNRGKHVIADKPLCTSLTELDEIEKLAGAKNLKVGCQFDMIFSPNLATARRLLLSGRTGRIHQIAIGAQHPLMYGTRPMWYFEPGRHGGTFNDIAVHAIHWLPWVTGREVSTVVAARTWNAFATQQKHFHDAAQAMLTLADGTGVMLDVSYATPASLGYALPHYWRMTFFCERGVVETSGPGNQVYFAEEGAKEPQLIASEPPTGDVLDAYLRELAGQSGDSPLTTAKVLRASRVTLQLQQAADNGRRDVKI
ncbi:MAG: Gfo/Idh/MocA family oxidoreductase [Phycisphaeraceae bacterium]|nr:Gfo/Idh/MocA family oxidoreductase [Phycisphaeraceae bacterium]